MPQPISAVNVERSSKQTGFFATNAGAKLLNSNGVDPARMYSEQILSKKGSYAMVDFLLDLLFDFLIFFSFYAIIILILFLVRIMVTTAKIRKWRQFAVPAVGIVGKLIDVNCIYDKYGQSFSYRHNFVLKIICGDQEFESVYSEEVLPDQEPTTYQGQKINILWSVSNHQYIQIADTPKEKQQLLKQMFNDSLSLYLRTHARRR